MGKPTGFIDYEREDAKAIEPKERIKNFKEFHIPLSMEKQQIQGARCMNCGVPFCQSGMTIMGMTSGCPLHNLVPEWNDLVYTGNWEQAYNRLKKTNNFPEFTSRVCPALCEAACTCGHWEDPVTCKANEHGIIENAYEKGYAAANPPRVRTGKKVAIIGSGPAGLAAADQLNKRGHQVTVFERDDRIGGLLMYGIPNMKLEKWVIDRKVDIMKEEGVEFVTGVNVGKDVKAAKLLKDYDRVILACGAKNPRDIKAPGRDAKGIYFAVDFLKATTKSLLDSDLKDNNYISAKGKKVVIIGGGVIGMEFASFFNSMGTEVHVVEMLDKILGPMDRELSEMLQAEYAKRGVKFYLGHKVTAVNGGDVTVEKDGETSVIQGEKVLLSVGRHPVTKGFGLETLAPEPFRNGIKVNGFMQTSVPNVYACGDITAFSLLAHTAVSEAEVAVDHILGKNRSMSYKAIPGVVYTNPEIAGVGKTEEELQAEGTPYTVKKIPMAFSGRFVAENEQGNGVCKLILAEDETIIGAHLLGNPASELIVIAGIAVEKGMKASELKSIVFPHPTVGEILKEAL